MSSITQSWADMATVTDAPLQVEETTKAKQAEQQTPQETQYYKEKFGESFVSF